LRSFSVQFSYSYAQIDTCFYPSRIYLTLNISWSRYSIASGTRVLRAQKPGSRCCGIKNDPIHSNPDAVIRCVTYFSINGDNTILDEKLEQLRGIDAINNSSNKY
jgi:hypothetical protein